MLRRIQASFVLLCLASVPAVAQEPANDAASPAPRGAAAYRRGAVRRPARGSARKPNPPRRPPPIRAAGTWS